MMRRFTTRCVRKALAQNRAVRWLVGLLAFALMLPPQFGFAAELHYARGG